MHKDHLCIFLSITPLWLLLKQLPLWSQNVVKYCPYLASDYRGVKGNMYTARGPAFTITQDKTGNAQHLLSNCSLAKGCHWGRLSPQWWPLGHLETAMLISHSDNYWHSDVLCALCEDCLSVYVCQAEDREKNNRGRGRNVLVCYPVCVCVWGGVSTWKTAGFAHGPVGHPSNLTCWTLKVTLVLPRVQTLSSTSSHTDGKPLLSKLCWITPNGTG